MLDLNDFYIYVKLVDHGGIASAARATGIPTSTLSKRLAKLEDALGVRLIQRTSRRFAATDLGRDFYQHAAAMLIEAEAAENLVKGRLAEPAGMVRITSSVATAQMALSDLLLELADVHPRIEIVLHASDRFVDLVQEGFDLAVRAHFTPLPDSELIQRKLGASPNHLVAAEDYLRNRPAPVRPEDLASHSGLLSSPALAASVCCLRNAAGDVVEARPRPRFYADEPATLVKAAVKGLGIACLPEALCRPLIEQGRLRRVLPEWEARGATMTLLSPSRRGQLPAVRVAADFLADGLVRTMHLRRAEPASLT